MPLRLKTCTGPCGRSLFLDDYWKDAKQADGHMTRCKECVKQARDERQARREAGEIVPRWSEEERKARSERMKRLHAEGRVGGPAYGRMGGGAKKVRITKDVLNHFQERTDLVIRAVESNLRSKNKGQRMRAAEFLTNLEQAEDKREMLARGGAKDPAEMTAEELQEFVAQSLAEAVERGEIDPNIIDLPDSAVVEIQ